VIEKFSWYGSITLQLEKTCLPLLPAPTYKARLESKEKYFLTVNKNIRLPESIFELNKFSSNSAFLYQEYLRTFRRDK
jgi:hypothetical protein